MIKFFYLCFLLFSGITNANPVIDRFFNSEIDPPLYRVKPASFLVNELSKSCDDMASGSSEVIRRDCYFTVLGELSAFLKSRLKSRIDQVKRPNQHEMYTKKDAEKMIKYMLTVQHQFDKYYDAECNEDLYLPGFVGSGVSVFISQCKMELLINRINQL
mgnify:CR=1 FL=1